MEGLLSSSATDQEARLYCRDVFNLHYAPFIGIYLCPPTALFTAAVAHSGEVRGVWMLAGALERPTVRGHVELELAARATAVPARSACGGRWIAELKNRYRIDVFRDR